MPQYALFLHETPSDFTEVSPAEMEGIIQRYAAWGAELAERRIAGHKLKDEGGRHLRRSGGGIVASDGPYGEAKEVVGGLFIVEAPDYDAAVEIARTCPHMDFGWIEVREIDRP
jgi:hypothetical protein